MSRCRSCDAPLRWELTESGKRIPLDPEPYEGNDPRGLFAIRSGVALAVPPDAFPNEPVYRSHFATCPQGGLWRKV